MIIVTNVFRELAGLAIASIGSLPVIEQLKTGTFRWRGDPYSTTRKQDPLGWWGWMVAKSLFAVVALAVGGGVFLGVVPLHRP